MFLNHMPCSTKNNAYPGILPNKLLTFTVEVYKRTLMDSRSFSEHKWKCLNKGKNKVITRAWILMTKNIVKMLNKTT